MKNLVFGIFILMCSLTVFANKNKCSIQMPGYKVVKNSIFPFLSNKKKSCFFAFYTVNPDPMVDLKGDGNLGDSLWYGYYEADNPDKIYEFPKPENNFWSSVCSIDAVSFYAMHGNSEPDVTVIGSCDKNARNYTFPFVFIRHGDKYVLDEDVYSNLYGFMSLTVADVREYIKHPNTYYKVLNNRYQRG